MDENKRNFQRKAERSKTGRYKQAHSYPDPVRSLKGSDLGYINQTKAREPEQLEKEQVDEITTQLVYYLFRLRRRLGAPARYSCA